jgi:glycosyltransferase involved in cell wall biosynthesis
MHTYRGRCYKWGYFTRVDAPTWPQKPTKLKLIYVARMLDWKHPEIPVRGARALKDAGVDFELNMYGFGPELPRIERLIAELGVGDCVNLRGNVPNDEIHRQMQQHHCLCFTSDRNEGWGAVVNEAMANGCLVIGSDQIGSIPFLIRHGENGLIFRDQDQQDFNAKLLSVARDLPRAEQMARRAYRTISEEWSPHTAATRLMRLISALRDGQPTPFADGPCSVAPAQI